MATLEQAIRGRIIVEHRMPDHDGRTPLRPLYLAADFVGWVDETDTLHDEGWSPRSGRRTRFEHLEQTLADFRCLRRPLVGDLYRLQPDRDGMWKMHSPGLRIFGWAPDRYSFVAVTAAFEHETHGPDSVVEEKRKDVLRFVARHGLSHTVVLGDRRELFQQKA